MEIIIACKGSSLSETIRFAEDHNVGIEIKAFTSPMIFHSDWQGLLVSVKKQLQDFEGQRSLHSFFDLGPYKWDRMTIQALKADYQKCLLVALELETPTIIAHSTYFPGLTNWKYKDWLNSQTELWGFIAAEAKNNNITIAIENIVDEKPDSILNIIEEVNLPNLKACIDFGHLNLITTEKAPVEWAESLEKYLYYTHIHNNNGRYDSHSSIDNGTLDYDRIFKKLFELKNLPKIAIEVDTLEGVKTTLYTINKLNNDMLPISSRVSY